jgi:hypothetical protein
MQYFRDGLDNEELRKEYKKLAKKYHPDICKDPNATEIMKEINHQFDEYFTNQMTREYTWVDTAKAKAAAQKVRATLLVWLLRDKEAIDFPRWQCQVEKRASLFWWWREYAYIQAYTTNDPSWKNFRGGLAYCSYGEPNEFNEVYLKKLDAKLTPATDVEMYWYNRDHWGDTDYDRYEKIRCRYGVFWGKTTPDGYILFVKVTLPNETMKVGETDPEGEEKYNSRSIETVFVKYKWIRECEVLERCTGSDFIYPIFQDCTVTEFNRTHDVIEPEMSQFIRAKKISKDDLWFIPDPMVAYFARKGIVEFYQSEHNYRIRYGMFNKRVLEQNMHLLTIDDVENIQDYLDEINSNFDSEVRRMIKSGKIRIKI